MTALHAAFRAVLAYSVAGAVAAVAVAVATWLLRRMGAPRAVAAALWLVVLVRLTCPAGLSVVVPQPLQAAQQTVQTWLPQLQQATDRSAVEATNVLQPGAAQLILPEEPAEPRPLTLWDGAALLWLAGVAVLVLRAAQQSLRLHRSIQFACRAETAAHTLYYESEQIAAPFVLGTLQPRICLPVGLSADERTAVLAHENAHLRRGDHLLRPAFYLAVCLHWFNPAAWWAFAGFCRDTEAACDEAVLHTLGEAIKPEYCRALLRFAAVRQRSPMAVAFAPDSLPARVQGILRWRKPRRSLSVVSLLLAAVVFTACMAQPADSPANPDVVVVGQDASSAQLQTGETNTDAASEAADMVWYWPVPEYEFVSCWAEQNPHNGHIHRGVDICAPEGTAIASAAEGVVLYAGWGGDLDPTSLPPQLAGNGGYSGYGNLVIVQHAPGIYTLYAHCSTVAVAAGDTVTAGQTIAAVGNTGRSTGAHLHWELQAEGESIPPQQVFAAYATD